MSWYLLILTLFLNTISIVFSLSSSSMMMTWFMMELNLMSFVGMMLFTSGKQMKMMAIKYFTFQVNASVVLFLFILFKSLSMVNLEMIMMLVLISKLGMAPIHMWFVSILSKLEWNMFLWMSIPQKLIPLMIISMMSEMGWNIILMTSVVVSTLYGMAQVKIKKVLAASSVFSLNWLFLAMLLNTNLWLMFFLVYSLMKFTLILSLLAIQKSTSHSSLIMTKLVSVLSIMGLAGIPPSPMFFLKLDVIMNGVISTMPFILLLTMTASLVMLYMYMNTIMSLMILSSSNSMLLTNNMSLFYIMLFITYMSMFIMIFN